MEDLQNNRSQLKRSSSFIDIVNLPKIGESNILSDTNPQGVNSDCPTSLSI